MIKVKNLSKYFGDTAAVNDVSFEIGKGEIVGFLGPNGAGKTTLMRILTSYLRASRGSVSVGGFDPARNPLAVCRLVGYLPETPPLYPDMTVKSYLHFAARLKGVRWRDQKKNVDKALSDCLLNDVPQQTISTLSRGYRQRVGLAQAIINDPDVLILDEPTNGLDPVQNRQIRGLIQNLEQKRTVILSTHILPEIEQIAKRVLIVKNGRLVTDDSLENLRKEHGNKSLEDVFLDLVANKREEGHD